MKEKPRGTPLVPQSSFRASMAALRAEFPEEPTEVLIKAFSLAQSGLAKARQTVQAELFFSRQKRQKEDKLSS